MLESYDPKKLHFQENAGDVVLFSALADMWAYGFHK